MRATSTPPFDSLVKCLLRVTWRDASASISLCSRMLWNCQIFFFFFFFFDFADVCFYQLLPWDRFLLAVQKKVLIMVVSLPGGVISLSLFSTSCIPHYFMHQWDQHISDMSPSILSSPFSFSTDVLEAFLINFDFFFFFPSHCWCNSRCSIRGFNVIKIPMQAMFQTNFFFPPLLGMCK